MWVTSFILVIVYIIHIYIPLLPWKQVEVPQSVRDSVDQVVTQEEEGVQFDVDMVSLPLSLVVVMEINHYGKTFLIDYRSVWSLECVP